MKNRVQLFHVNVAKMFFTLDFTNSFSDDAEFVKDPRITYGWSRDKADLKAGRSPVLENTSLASHTAVQLIDDHGGGRKGAEKLKEIGRVVLSMPEMLALVTRAMGTGWAVSVVERICGHVAALQFRRAAHVTDGATRFTIPHFSVGQLAGPASAESNPLAFTLARAESACGIGGDGTSPVWRLYSAHLAANRIDHNRTTINSTRAGTHYHAAANRARLKEIGEIVGLAVRYDIGVDDLVERLQNIADFGGGALLEEVLRSLPEIDGEEIILATCGHITTRSDAETDRHGTSACRGCYEDGEYCYPEDDSTSLYNVDDLHYSEREDAYYTYDRDAEIEREEEEEEEEEEDPDTQSVYDWGTNVLRVLRAAEIESSPTGDFTIGMEFECEPDGYDNRQMLATYVQENVHPQAMCKNDGSLSSTGLEVVFAPMTLESTKSAWQSVAFPRGTTAWNGGSCGMHVHIDARAFTRLSLAKFVAFWNHNSNAALIKRVAGRHSSSSGQAARYAASIHDDTSSLVRALKKESLSCERYRCVNLTTLKHDTAKKLGVYSFGGGHHSQYDTVELRIFRASLKAERTLAQLEMAHATVEFARQGSMAAMNEKAFTEWLKRYGARYPHLKAFLGLQRAHKPAKDKAREVADTD